MDGSKILCMVVENLHFLDSLNYLPMSLKDMPKSFERNARRGTIPTSLKVPTMWDMRAHIPKPSSMGQTLCLVMNETYFRIGMRGLKTNF